MSSPVVIISCGDGRLEDPRRLLWLWLVMSKADLITLPGASICMTHNLPDITENFLVGQIKFYIKAHPGIKEIWVVAHEDCAATTFLELTSGGMSSAECRKAQKKNYRDSLQMLRNMFDLRTRFFYQTLTNKIYDLP